MELVLPSVWGFSGIPKGPFRTKNATTIAKRVNYYAVVFLLRPPDLLRCGPFSERESVCNSQENGVRTRCAAVVNHRAIVKILRVVNSLRVVFLVRRGPLGCTSRVRKQRRTYTIELPLLSPQSLSGVAPANQTSCVFPVEPQSPKRQKH